MPVNSNRQPARAGDAARGGGWQARVLACSLAAFLAAPAFAVVPLQVDAFTSGGAADWEQTFSATPPTRITTGGALGPSDGYLQVRTTGNASGPGSHMTVVNISQWGGNYTPIHAVSLFARNLGPNPLYLRLSLQSNFGTIYASTTARVVPVAGPWQKITFPITATEFTLLQNAESFDAVRASVREVRLLSAQAGPNFRGDIGLAIAGYDEITAENPPVAVPMPVPALAILGLLMGAIGALFAPVAKRRAQSKG